MDVLMSLQGSQLEADDPTNSYMLQVRFDLEFNIYCFTSYLFNL